MCGVRLPERKGCTPHTEALLLQMPCGTGVACQYVLRTHTRLFRYSRFEVLAAAPRDTSKLMGVHRKVGSLVPSAASAEGDEVVTVAAA